MRTSCVMLHGAEVFVYCGRHTFPILTRLIAWTDDDIKCPRCNSDGKICVLLSKEKYIELMKAKSVT